MRPKLQDTAFVTINREGTVNQSPTDQDRVLGSAAVLFTTSIYLSGMRGHL